MKILQLISLSTLIGCLPVITSSSPAVGEDVAVAVRLVPIATGDKAVKLVLTTGAKQTIPKNPSASQLAIEEVAIDQSKRKRKASKTEIGAVLALSSFLTFFVAKGSDEWNANHKNTPRTL